MAISSCARCCSTLPQTSCAFFHDCACGSASAKILSHCCGTGRSPGSTDARMLRTAAAAAAGAGAHPFRRPVRWCHALGVLPRVHRVLLEIVCALVGDEVRGMRRWVIRVAAGCAFLHLGGLVPLDAKAGFEVSVVSLQSAERSMRVQLLKGDEGVQAMALHAQEQRLCLSSRLLIALCYASGAQCSRVRRESASASVCNL